MEVAHPFCTPQPRHIAELRIEAAQSPVSFSDPCAAGRKRRCLFPPFSPRKKMLLELHPFSSMPAPAPSLPATARTGCSASGLSPAPAPTGGSGDGGNGGFASFFALAEKPLMSAGSNNGGGALPFFASWGRPLTPMISTASGGLGVSVPQPSLSPGPRGSSGNGADEFLVSPEPSLAGSTGIGGGLSTFLASPKTGIWRTGSPVAASTKELVPAVAGSGGLVSLPFVFSASPTSSLPVHEPRDRTLWSRRQRSQQLQIILPRQKVVKTETLATGESSHCAPSMPTAKPFCASLASLVEASKQGAKKDILAAGDASLSPSPYPSPSGKCCTFVTSPTRPRSVEKVSKREWGVQTSGVAGDAPTSPAAACSGAEVVVRVTCSCGAKKEFCFNHSH